MSDFRFSNSAYVCRRVSLGLILALGVLVCLSWPSLARAQRKAATAKTLTEQGEWLLKKHDYPDALVDFRKAATQGYAPGRRRPAGWPGGASSRQ